MNLPFLGGLLTAMILEAASRRGALQALAITPFICGNPNPWRLPAKTSWPSLPPAKKSLRCDGRYLGDHLLPEQIRLGGELRAGRRCSEQGDGESETRAHEHVQAREDYEGGRTQGNSFDDPVSAALQKQTSAARYFAGSAYREMIRVSRKR